MENKVKKIYICPFCSAQLDKQEGFEEEAESFECRFCGNTIRLKEENETDPIIRKTKPVLEFTAGLVLIGFGALLSAAEYLFSKKESVDPVIEDTDHNII